MKNNLTRRDFLSAFGATTAGLLLAQKSQSLSNKNPKKMLLYVGTYTSKASKGIYVYKFDAETGGLSPLHSVENVAEPSFLTIAKNRKYLYAVNELVEFEGKKSGAVSAFAINQKTGDLKFLNRQPSLGGAPCHISVSDNGKFVLVANYVGGNVSVFPVEAGGRLGAAVDFVQHSGSGPNRERQEAPHAHSIILDKNNRFVFVNDLGIDRIMIYEFDAERGKLKPNPAQAFYQTKPGAGPRHFAFHPNGRLAFVINELDLTISSLAFEEKSGTLKEIQTVPTLPAGDARKGASCADIHVAPSGKFLYGSNRGHNSIVVYGIDEKTGTLEYIEHASTRGKKPRNFAIDPTGGFLLAANQDSDSGVVFRIDRRTGKLQPTEMIAKIPTPVCLKLIPDFSN